MLLALLVLLGAAAPAHARSSFCSESGDVCYGVVRGERPLTLSLTLAARSVTSSELCVSPPRGARQCERFRVRRGGQGVYGSQVRWRRQFRHHGSGTSRARWSGPDGALGPAVSFRL